MTMNGTSVTNTTITSTSNGTSGPDEDEAAPSSPQQPACTVICVKEKTFLCRWGEEGDGYGRVECKPSTGILKRQSPTRSSSPGVEAAKTYRAASEQSGIQLGNISLVPITTSFSEKEDYNVTEGPPALFSDILKDLGKWFADNNNNKSDDHNTNSDPNSDNNKPATTSKKPKVKIVHCVRREGCGNCRMHGQALGDLVATCFNGPDDDIEIVGIIKGHRNDNEKAKNEAAIARKALYNFQQEYFQNYPLFRDHSWDVFQFLGDRKISNATMVAKAPKLLRLYAQKNIENVVFDGYRDVYTQGGLLILDAQCKLRYVYYDRYGDELDTDALKLAIQDCQRVASSGGKKLNMASRAMPTRGRMTPTKR